MTDIVEKLKEKIITDAFVEGDITSGALADRLIRERLDAADEITRLREENEKLRIEVMSDYHEGWEEGLSAMKEENEKMKYFLRHNVFAEKQFGVYFVCGEGGDKDRNGMPEQIYVCPAYGSDVIYRYKRMDSSAPQW